MNLLWDEESFGWGQGGGGRRKTYSSFNLVESETSAFRIHYASKFNTIASFLG